MSPSKSLASKEDAGAFTLDYAQSLDAKDPLRHLRDEFHIPTKADLKRKKLEPDDEDDNPEALESCTYLCGNSLGLQPKRTFDYIYKYLSTWATKGVYGHFKELEDAMSPPWVHMDDAVKGQTAKIVGALPSEVAVMESLTVNLHLLMASFYRPTKERYKIIIESKAFPSDHYAALSQLAHHGHPHPASSASLPSPDSTPLLTTSHILSTIEAHASTTALILLPGIQFYTGQLLDIATITAFAHKHNITIGWDLAHATGNVPLQLHDWDVDFAAWCNYKYMNSGPGAIGGLFLHPRLSGWWGSDKASRFRMENRFVPMAGAAGWQVSNPSAVDMTAVLASLSVFGMTDMEALRGKSLKLTGYLERLLLETPRPYTIITPSNKAERGAQLSVRLEEGLLDRVMEVLEDEGVVVDERKPNVVRVAPAPLYNSFEDVWRFVQVFQGACRDAQERKMSNGENEGGRSLMVDGGKDRGGWEEIK
ncbi:Kynureninase (L-kynurenine hydrolase) [Coniosporium tulheliwenetii]|uniref:Kynureninase (L-kynurenine hydrolase) n=1 Tax=Coniosporium tulheliwenetii TaxID=3383036 RepID=A0ACC2ZPQ5_9PEZI|nr:Kynureninase (L-kynurenine hydrolase) [Cladosporium sp. JES 115]